MDPARIFSAVSKVTRLATAHILIAPKSIAANDIAYAQIEGRQALAELAELFAPAKATARPKGNDERLWYWTRGNSVHKIEGGYASGDEAQKYAKDLNPDGDYTVLCAERHAIGTEVFSAAEILASLAKHNPQCWPAGIPPASERELADLAAKLSDCLDRWVRKNGFDNTTALHTIHAQDYFPPSSK